MVSIITPSRQYPIEKACSIEGGDIINLYHCRPINRE
jgi:hypothetical protein